MTELSDGVNMAMLPTTGAARRIVECKAVASQDGDFSQFTFTDGDGRSFVTVTGIEHIGAIAAEMREASLQMVDLQAATLDRGVDKLFEVAQTALRPIDMQVLIEPMTGDRIFIFQFNDHAPLVFRRNLVDIYRGKASVGASRGKKPALTIVGRAGEVLCPLPYDELIAERIDRSGVFLLRSADRRPSHFTH